MRILCVADLHDHRPWYGWLLEQAQSKEFDLIVCAGDFLQTLGGGGKPLHDQILFHVGWFKEMRASQQPFAFCSGNHDLDDPDRLSTEAGWVDLVRELVDDGTRLMRESWMQLSSGGVVVGPAGNFTLSTRGGPVHVTCLPWRDYRLEPMLGKRLGDHDLAAQGRVARTESGAPWVLVAHEPPSPSMLSPLTRFKNSLYVIIDQFQPDVVVCGHHHQLPRGTQRDIIGRTICILPGRIEGPVPAHVVHELNTGVAERHPAKQS